MSQLLNGVRHDMIYRYDTQPNDENLYTTRADEPQGDLSETRQAIEQGKLINFQDAMRSHKNLGRTLPEHRYRDWRVVFNFTVDEVKNQKDWPINRAKRDTEQESRHNEKDDAKPKHQDEAYDQHGDDKSQREDTNTKVPENREHQSQENQDDDGASASDHDAQPKSPSSGEHQSSENEDDSDDVSSQAASILRAARHEQEYLSKLRENDGRQRSNVRHAAGLTIDEADQYTPDNWIPRSQELIRLTGKHPLNAESSLTRLYESGFITPNDIHYVRNHGAVPQLRWEIHRLKVTCNGGTTVFSMRDITDNFESFNLPVAMGCSNNRRKELNMIKHTTGFNWGPAAVGCAYWKGALLRDVLVAAGVRDDSHSAANRPYYLHLQGADTPNDVHYETSIPLDYVMDATNDVLLAYEMNDVPLPPDHGYPLRVVIPGYIGGRQVKWLQAIWLSDKENDSYYHLKDNRMLPAIVTESGSELAKFFFRDPDTAAYEQALQSLIAYPAQGERIQFSDIRKGDRYQVKGIAYNGRGDQVRRVELSLDGGRTWLYCIKTFPKAPRRHGRKFWTWCFWEVEVALTELIRAPAITVRAMDVKSSSQPEHPIWNLTGTMNNGQYTVKPQLDGDCVIFRHPVEPADGGDGWMQDSVENQLKDAEHKTEAPSKQFSQAEVEKHQSQNDCWIVVDNCVYDATSVLDWHPGGPSAVMTHAGAVHAETTSEFASIHDGYAYEKLNECVIGTLDEKAKKLIADNARAAAEAGSADVDAHAALQQHRWTPVELVERWPATKDSSMYRFKLPDEKQYLNIGTCQHISVGFHLKDKMLVRPYTPVKPVLPRDSVLQVDDQELKDGNGFFTLLVKTYFPDENQPGGAMSTILSEIELGEQIEIRGPFGDVIYEGHGAFTMGGKKRRFKRVSLILGGTGLTPAMSLVARSCLTNDDMTELRVIDANKTEDDILLRNELEQYERASEGRLKVTHVLNEASDDWNGLRGNLTEEIIRAHLFPPSADNVALLCGPPPMIEKAVIPALEDWGYKQDDNMFGL